MVSQYLWTTLKNGRVLCLQHEPSPLRQPSDNEQLKLKAKQAYYKIMK